MIRRSLLPRPVTRPVILDPLAFVLALVGAPILVAFMFFWILLIPVFAIFYGGPIYLALGVPSLLWYIPRYGISTWRIGFFAVLVNTLGCGAIALALIFFDAAIDAKGFAWFYWGFGTPVPFVWGFVFALLYPNFQTKFNRTLNASQT